MNDHYTPVYSHSSLNMKSSAIRDMMKLTGNPQMISFAGGLPGPEAFPLEELKDIIDRTIAEHGSSVFQYGTTEGYTPLRESICDLMYHIYGLSASPDNILVTSGSQQALYLLCKVLLNPGDAVITENPTFVGAISCFRSFMAEIHPLAIGNSGMDPVELDKKICELIIAGKKPRFIYTIPSIHNPTGITVDNSRRKAIYSVASKHDLMIVEDDPYGMIRYDNKHVVPFKNIDTEKRIVYLGSFSKTVSPGMRTGWLNAQEETVRRCTIAKQGEDTCSHTMSQFVIHEFIDTGSIYEQIERVKKIYRDKRDLMTDAIDRIIPSALYETPGGGLFLWLKFPENINTMTMHEKALKRNVAYVSGNSFYPGQGGENEMRLNFSFSSPSDIEEGIMRLGEVIEEESAKQ